MNKQMLLILPFTAAAVSVFVWAFFDVRWWVPIETHADIGRAMIICGFHLAGLMSPLLWGRE